MCGLAFVLLRNSEALADRCYGAARTAVPTEDPDNEQSATLALGAASNRPPFPLALKRCHGLAKTNLEKALAVAADAEGVASRGRRGKKKSGRSAKGVHSASHA